MAKKAAECSQQIPRSVKRETLTDESVKRGRRLLVAGAVRVAPGHMFGQLCGVVVVLGVVVVEPLCVVVVDLFVDVDVLCVAANATPPPVASARTDAAKATALFGLISTSFRRVDAHGTSRD